MLNLTILTLFLFGFISIVSSSRNPDAGLRQELIESIKDIQQYGEPKEFDSSLRDLLAQLERYQMVTPHAMQIDWDVAEVTATTTSKSVCMVVSSFEGMYINSGVGTAYYALANLLISQGHKVTIIYTRDDATSGDSWEEWVANYKAQGITLLALPPSSIPLHMTSLQATSLRVYRYLVTLPSFDIVHFADFEGHGFYPTLAKKVTTQFSSTSFVVGLHGPSRWVIESNFARIPTSEIEIDTDWMERMSVENADAVWTPSAYMASWMSVQGWTLPSSVHLLPLAPGPEFKGISASSVTVHPKEFVYFGRLEVRKGLVLFCDALDLLAKIFHTLDKEISVTFLGSSSMVNDEEGSDYVIKRAGKWPFPVKMITDASRQTAFDYLMDSSNSRIAIIPSLADNAPYTVYECLYAGIPFLASSIPSISPLFADDHQRSAHLFETKPHHIVSKMAGALRNGLSSATPSFTVAQSEAVWTTFYSKIQPKEAVMTTADVPLVSVVITHYNRPELVQQAIASVESQTYTNIEVILVDDGSTLEAAHVYLNSIESKFAEKNWKIIRGTNQFLGAARNAGAEAAQGKYLLFLDDDNVFAETAVASYVTAAKLTGAGIVTAGHGIFSGTSSPSVDSIVRHWMPLGASLTAGLFKNTFGDANFFVLKSKFNLVGGFTEDKGVGLEEHEFFAKSIFNGTKLEVIPEVLMYYRQHSENDQMLYTTDMRLGEARRLRPYLSALGETAQKNKETEQSHQSNRRSLVNLVARNAASPRTSITCNISLTAINPSNGIYPGGNLVTIVGAGFSCTTITAVNIGTNACTGVQIVSDTSLTCTVPQGNNVATYTVSVIAAGIVYPLTPGYTYTPTPPPLGTSAILSATGVLSVTFNVPTNEGGLNKKRSSSCSSLTDATTFALLGNGPSCSWPNPSTLAISLGTDATLAVGDNFTMPEGAIAGAGPSGSPNAKISLVIQLASGTATMVPVPNIYTTTASICEGLTLNASGSIGSGGRQFTSVVWTLLSASKASISSVAAINASLATASSQRSLVVVISPNNVTSGASYDFQLTLTNWFGKSKSTEQPVSKLLAAAPSVGVQPSGVTTIYDINTATFTGSYSGMACAATQPQGTSEAAFLWSLFPPPPPGITLITNNIILNIPAGLAPATTYSVNFTVTDTATGASNTVSVPLVVEPRALIISLNAPNSIQQNTSLVLDATGTSDPEGYPLQYAWSCVSQSNGASCPVTFTNAAIQIINTNLFTPGTFTFTLNVTGAFGRQLVTAKAVTITQLPTLQISIKQQYTSYPSNSAITLNGIITSTTASVSSISWQWSTTNSVPSSAYPNGLNTQNLYIAANSLTAGQSYTYTLTATVQGSGVTGQASAVFAITSYSTSDGIACAVPTINQGYDTIEYFNFGTKWANAAGVNEFQVFYSFGGSGVLYPVTPQLNTYNVSTLLPVGSLKLTGIATSSTGLSTTISCSANVAPGALDVIVNDIQSVTNSYDTARITFSMYNSYQVQTATDDQINLVTTGRDYAMFAVFNSWFNDAIDGAISADDAVLLPGVCVKITDPTLNQLNSIEVFSAGTMVTGLYTLLSLYGDSLTAQQSISSFNFLMTASDNIDTQITRLAAEGLSRKRDMRATNSSNTSSKLTEMIQKINTALANVTTSNPWANVTSLQQAQKAQSALGQQIRISMLSKLPLGLVMNFYTDYTIKTLYRDSPSVIDGNGASLGVNSTLITPAGIIPTNVLGDSSIVMAYMEAEYSSYAMPSGFVLASSVFNLYGLDSSFKFFNFSEQPVSVVVPDSVLTTNNGTYACAMYVNGNWTADGVTTARTTENRTLCTFPQIATFALLNKPAGGTGEYLLSTTGQTEDDNKKGGIPGGAIAGIVIGAVALVAIIAVGSAYGAKKHRDNAAIAVGRPSPRSGDSGSGGVAIDPPLDPIFVPSYMGPMYVPPASGSAGPVYLNRSAVVNQPQASPVIYGTFQQPAAVEPIAPSPAAVARRANNNNNAAARDADFSSDSEPENGRSRSNSMSSDTSRSSRYSRRDSDDDTLSSEIQEIAGELSRQMPRGHHNQDELSDRMDL